MAGGLARAIVILLLFVLSGPLHAADQKPFGPWENHAAQGEAGERERADFPSSFLIRSVRFYQDYISPVTGQRCPMHPSCSAYSIQAIKKHGFLMGIIMTADRLIHESDEISLGPIVEVEGELKIHDSVENNDFWWANPKK